MKRPPYLKKGDKIGIVAPAGKVNRDDIMPGLTLFHLWGMEIELGSNVFKTNHQFSATDELRIADLQQMLDDPSIKAIVSARGGYGTIRIIDKLDFSAFKKNPKWIVGFSDITVLHSHINNNFGIETIHAAMLNGLSKSEEAAESLRKGLTGEPISYTIEPNALNRDGETEAEVIGGNLSILYALNGSVSDIVTEGKILFIEDLSEYLYHIDRMMHNFKRSGKLSQLKGLIVGGFTDLKDNPTPFGKSAYEIIRESVAEYNYPVCFDFPAGHINKNLALVFGRKARFSVNSKNVLLSFSSSPL